MKKSIEKQNKNLVLVAILQLASINKYFSLLISFHDYIKEKRNFI
jgi:hypothetical protein